MQFVANYIIAFKDAILQYLLIIENIILFYILKAIKNATGTSVVFPVNTSFIHYVLVLTSVPSVGERFTKT